jgi:hypothetical protein
MGNYAYVIHIENLKYLLFSKEKRQFFFKLFGTLISMQNVLDPIRQPHRRSLTRP